MCGGSAAFSGEPRQKQLAHTVLSAVMASVAIGPVLAVWEGMREMSCNVRPTHETLQKVAMHCQRLYFKVRLLVVVDFHVAGVHNTSFPSLVLVTSSVCRL